tara:strand:+ start:100 stop:249 length:150 start_codon:yes stop_codon:yes gene_type:complete
LIKKLLKKILDWFRKSKNPPFKEEVIHPTEQDESDDLEEEKRLQSEDTH